MNQINLIGRLTADPEIKETSTGAKYARFTLAVDRNYKCKADGKQLTDFIRCVAWNGTCDHISKYFFKGQRMGATGSLYINSYTDGEGNKKSSSEVNVNSVYFADSKIQSNNNNDDQYPDIEIVPCDDKEELPF